MKTLLKSTITAAVLMTTALSANANGFHGYPPAVVAPAPAAYGWHHGHGHPLAGLDEIRARQSHQIARIERGFHRGTITRWEFRRLMAEQHDIAALERAFVADGFLASHEHAELHRRLDFAARHIQFESRDAERRHW